MTHLKIGRLSAKANRLETVFNFLINDKTRGHETYDSDRTPVLGIISREIGQISLKMKHNNARKNLQPTVFQATQPGSTVNTDE